MRIRLALVTAALALLLVPAAVSASSALPPGGSSVRRVDAGPGKLTPDRVAAGATVAGAEGPGVSRLAAPRLGVIENGPCTVTGVVQDRSGAPVAGAFVDWGYYDAQGYWVFGNEAETQADGSFSFSGVTATTDGELDVYLSSGAGYQAWSLTFSASPAENHFVLRPGIAPFSTTRTLSPGWGYWDSVLVDTWGSEGGGTTTISATGNAYVMPPDYDYALVYYFSNQAVEWVGGSSIPVVAGGTGGTPIAVSQDDAQSILVTKPYWASGKPGTTVKLRMGNWPAGRQAGFYGYSEYPYSYPTKEYGATYTSNGAAATVSLTVPANATPGYDFEIHAYRSDTQDTALDINDFFQVCTLKSSKTSVRSGGAIRLAGRVPLAGHLGSKLAPAGKRVTIFKRTTAPSVQPRSWTSPRGWTKVATVSTTRSGAYYSAYLHPRRTTWYIVRYPGSSNTGTGQWYWKAFTSFVKVRVY
jgi:hypothetical protein